MRLARSARFSDRYPFVGPALYSLAITFFVAQVAVAYNWQSKAPHTTLIKPYHPYSFFANTISDLGETSKFGYGNPAMWSPDHVWMNIAFFLLGAVMILGTPLLYHEFSEQQTHRVAIGFGFALQALAGVGAILVGAIPENTHPLGHEVGAGLAIAVGTAGVLVLGLSLVPLPGRVRRFMLWCSPVSLVAILLYVLHEYLGFGPGGMERVAAYPEVIWLIIFGFYIGQSHYYFGSAHRPTASRLRLKPAGWLPIGQVNQPYSAPVALGASPNAVVNIQLVGTTKNGLTVTPAGDIQGTPTQPGIFKVRVSATVGGQSTEQNYKVRIEP